MDKRYLDAKETFEKGFQKQHDHRYLPRMRCVTVWGERLEFILPEGVEPDAFCRGEKTLDPKLYQVVAPGTQPALQEVIVNFDTSKIVFVYPEQ